MHKVFISYHHANDQPYKENLVLLGAQNQIFIDGSVNTRDIPENLTDQQIRRRIRDDYLGDTTVTIVLVGTETKERKHVDWEIYSSMFDGAVNKRSGILVIQLPTTGCDLSTAAHANEKEIVHPDVAKDSWITVKTREGYHQRYPYVPERIIDNLLADRVKISVVPWNKVTGDIEKLRFLVEATYNDRLGCEYDLSRRMRGRNA